jgi:hypothetical protein
LPDLARTVTSVAGALSSELGYHAVAS